MSCAKPCCPSFVDAQCKCDNLTPYLPVIITDLYVLILCFSGLSVFYGYTNAETLGRVLLLLRKHSLGEKIEKKQNKKQQHKKRCLKY